MKHQKRQVVPKNWPVKRKGTKFSIKAKSGTIPILIILRDMLEIVKNRRECKIAINLNKIEINLKPIKEVSHGVNILDIIKIVPANKNYMLNLSETGKYKLVEIKESGEKPIKIINKTLLKGKKIQLNLMDGRNIITDKKCKTNDSILFNFKTKKISEIIEMKKGAKAIVYAGKHSGKGGIIEEIDNIKRIVKIKTEKEEINVLIKQIIIIK